MVIPLGIEAGALVTSGLFEPGALRSVFHPREVRIKAGGVAEVRKRVNQQAYYKELKERAGAVRTMQTTGSYGGLNLVYSTDAELDTFFDRVRLPVKAKASALFDLIEEIASRYDASNRILVVNCDFPAGAEKALELNEVSSAMQAIFVACRGKFLQDRLRGMKVVMYSPARGDFFLFETGEGLDLARLSSKLSSFVKSSDPNAKMGVEEREAALDVATGAAAPTVAKTVASAVADRILSALNLTPKVHALTGEELDSADRIRDMVEDAAEKAGDGATEERVTEELDGDEEFLKYLAKVAEDSASAKKAELEAGKTEQLRLKQGDTKVGNLKLSDILSDFRSKAVEVEEIPITTLNKSAKISKLKDFDRSYHKLQYDKDLAAIGSSFSGDPELPVFVQKIDREDTSDEMTIKETLTFEIVDSKNSKHTFKVDVPKVIDGNFVHINGSKKQIVKQLIPLPVVKVGEGEVKVTTNYNRLFVTRQGQKTSRHAVQLRKYLQSDDAKDLGRKLKVKFGDNRVSNRGLTSSVEFDELSKDLMEIETDKIKISFDRNAIQKEVESITGQSLNLEDWDEFVIGYSKTEKVFFTVLRESGVVLKRVYRKNDSHSAHYADSISSMLVDELAIIDPKVVASVYSQTAGTSYAYSRVTIVGRRIPLIVVLGLRYGLKSVLDRYKVDYEFSPTRRNLSPDEKRRLNVVRFEDGYLYYPAHPIRYTLLLNGLNSFSANRPFEDFEKPEAYVEALEGMTGSRAVAKGILNTASLLIDPITRDILDEMKLPDDFLGLLLHCNTMLETSGHTRPNDVTNYRVRGGEIIASLVYESFSKAYKAYRDSSRAGRPVKITAPREEVIRNLLETPNLDEYSILSPVLEAEKMGSISAKGPNGINDDNAYSREMRAYDKSMIGLLALNTPDSASVGVVRQLTFNPKIMNNRGFLASMSPETISAMGMLSPSEALSPFTSQHADPPRIGMQVTQSKHIIPITKQHRPLIGNGMEKALAHIVGSDFAFKAAADGVVEEIDEKNEIMVIRYKDGVKDVVDLSESVAKNSAGGFYISNSKKTDLKKGAKFTKGQVLAANPQYFTPDDAGDHILTSGRLTRVAITSGWFTYEDSSLVTMALREDMSSMITMRKAVPIGPNSNVLKVAKKGQKVKTGEALIQFDTSFDDKEVNALLGKIGEEFEEILDELGKNTIASKYTGDIVDIKVYYNRDLEELSPSLQKLVKGYIASVSTRQGKIKKVRTDTQTPSAISPVPVQKLPPEAKVGGVDFDGVLIEFYVRYKDKLGVGDKITFDTALKTIVAEVTPNGQEPYSEGRPDLSVDAVVSPLSIVSRMTTDVYNKLFLNKILVELKRKVVEDYLNG
jgi:hypothetical protein